MVVLVSLKIGSIKVQFSYTISTVSQEVCDSAVIRMSTAAGIILLILTVSYCSSAQSVSKKTESNGLTLPATIALSNRSLLSLLISILLSLTLISTASC